MFQVRASGPSELSEARAYTRTRYLPHRSHFEPASAARACSVATVALEMAAQACSEATVALESAARARSVATVALEMAARAFSKATVALKLRSKSRSRKLFKEAVLGDASLCCTSLCSAMLRAWICTGSH